MNRRAFGSQSEIPARGWILRVSTTYSLRFIPPSRKGWAWGCRSAAQLSRRTADGSGRQRIATEARRFSSHCRLVVRENKAVEYVEMRDHTKRLKLGGILFPAT